MVLNPLESLTRATFRTAEFGFFGFIVKTREQTPFFCGQFWRSGELVSLPWTRRAPFSTVKRISSRS